MLSLYAYTMINEFWDKYLNEFKAFAYSIFIYLEIDGDTVKILFWLMVIDTVFGIAKVFSLGQEFNLRKLVLGIISKLSLLVIPLTIALIGKGLSYDFKVFVDVVLKILIVSDGISILTNILSIRTKREVKNVDIITALLITIRKYFIKLANGFLKNIKL